MKLTEKLVAKLKPPAARRVDVPDDAMPGLFVRVGATGSRTYVVLRRRKGGRLVRLTIAKSPTVPLSRARTLARQAIAELASGGDPRAAKRAHAVRGLTVAQALEEYLTIGNGRKESYIRDCRRMLSAEFKPLARKAIVDLDDDAVLRWFKAQASIAVAAKSGRVLRAVLRYASRRHGLRAPDGRVASDILTDLKLWPRTTRKSRTIEDVLAWRAALQGVPQPVADLFTCLLLTGLRRDELRLAQWQQVDLAKATLSLPDPKGRRPQLVPLPRQVLAIVKRRAAAHHGTKLDAVFSTDGLRPLGTSTLQRWVNHTSLTMGTPWSVHDLRRTFASRAAPLVSEYVLKKLLHHATGADVTAGYVALDAEQLRREGQKVADAL